MKHLYDIPIEAEQIEAELSETYGELTPELEVRISEFIAASKDKVEAAAAVVRSLEADAGIVQAESERMRERAAGLQRGADRLKELMLQVVDRAFEGKLKTPRFTIWGQNAAKKITVDIVPGTDICRLAAMEPWAFRIKDPEVNLQAVKDAVKAGQKIPDGLFVQEGEATRFLRIK
jgi:hypothetical protein